MIDEFKGNFSFLSNFAEVRAGEFPTGEHYFQYLKVLLAGDLIGTMDGEPTGSNVFLARAIGRSATPGQAKRKARAASINVAYWERVKIPAMGLVVMTKFRPGLTTAHQLIGTWPHGLIEGNTWHDNTWGACTCKQCEDIEPQNLLGLALMNHRRSLLAMENRLVENLYEE